MLELQKGDRRERRVKMLTVNLRDLTESPPALDELEPAVPPRGNVLPSSEAAQVCLVLQRVKQSERLTLDCCTRVEVKLQMYLLICSLYAESHCTCMGISAPSPVH